MSFDGLMLHSMTKELQTKLLFGRVNKISHPYNNEIILTMRSQKQNYKLLLSAHATYARCQTTEIPFANPETPSNYCLTLRKYLEGAILTKIQQLQTDRIIFFVFEKRNEIGDLKQYALILEIMGKHSNLILIDTETHKIIDCIKHISPHQNTYRTLLPGSLYQLPPRTANKINPFDYDEQQLFKFLNTTSEFNPKMIQQTFEGFALDSAKELSYRLNLATQKTPIFQKFINQFEDIEPCCIQNDNKNYLLAFPFQCLTGQEIFFFTLSELCDYYFGTIAEQDRVKQQMGNVLHHLQKELKKNQQKLPKLEQNLVDADQAEIYRQKGELLTTFLNEVQRGAYEVTLSNYYNENQPLTIKLNPAYSPNKNAQKYFQKYQKLKKSVHVVQEQIEQTKAEIDYLETLITEVEMTKPIDLPALIEELQIMGYVKKQTKNKRPKQTNIKPYQYYATDGTSIIAGKNNLQNDQLTLKKAKKDYIWLHTKNIPGSHVIIEDSQPSDETIIEAAKIAAYHSKYRNSANVPVDYVKIKNIHKPNGSKPGFVIYKQQKTVYVTPEEHKIITK